MRFRKWIGHKRLRLFRAPVYIHWSVFLVVAVLALSSVDTPAYGALAIVAYFSVIVIHECGHAWVAKRRHHEVLCIRIGVLHGNCEYEAPDYEWDDVAIAWGGVLAQFIVAIPMVMIQVVATPGMLGPFGTAAMVKRVLRKWTRR
jgi:hypothetical protein